ncbi:biofilm development regulator YmgB/AriR family protein [Entomohabitans teleogrylli]|uniref:biofilm development regulator YmgB/AriR family protein n=1 Tax=Entomohabitans teleogrylli TaxID=1384589 RepID=UPI00073D435E|nr:biofilm development regulator YmgB/AriR family protein [Entomohabitans teleogrylli]
MNTSFTQKSTHRIPAEFIPESALLKMIENDIRARNGEVTESAVIHQLMLMIKQEQNVILCDIYRQTLEFMIQEHRIAS